MIQKSANLLLFFLRDLSDVASRAILIRIGNNDLTAVFSLFMIWFVKKSTFESLKNGRGRCHFMSGSLAVCDVMNKAGKFHKCLVAS